jgi:TPP-dependent pyruvate/acetoin dehydrogenase alpha subunit
MHLYDPAATIVGCRYHLAHHYYGGNGIVGTPPPLGTGLAYALQYLNK